MSYLVITVGDGRTVSVLLNHSRAMAIQSFDQSLAYVARKESSSLSKTSILSEYQVQTIGTIEPSLRLLSYKTSSYSQGVLICCDRPTLFYVEGDRTSKETDLKCSTYEKTLSTKPTSCTSRTPMVNMST